MEKILKKGLESYDMVKYFGFRLRCVCVWVGKERRRDKESFFREGKYFVKKVIYF